MQSTTSLKKTNTMVFEQKQIGGRIKVEAIKSNEVEIFTCLGSNMAYDSDCMVNEDI